MESKTLLGWLVLVKEAVNVVPVTSRKSWPAGDIVGLRLCNVQITPPALGHWNAVCDEGVCGGPGRTTKDKQLFPAKPTFQEQ